MVDSGGMFGLAAGLMSPADPKRPVVEQPPDGPSVPPVSDRALELRVRQQEILAELGVVALRGMPFTELLNEAVRLAAEGLEAEFCKILEYIPSEKRLLMRAGVGWHAGVVGTASVGADLESPAGFALHTGKPVISNQLENEQRFRTSELLASHGVRRAINVILQGDGVAFGVLEVDSKSEGDFSEKDIAFLQGAANIIGMAIERQRYERNLKAALEHQQVLVQEINHRVKNSLQLVASMLNLRAGAQDDPTINQILGDASSRVGAISRAHDRLYRGSDIARIELQAYLSDICRDLTDATPDCPVVFESARPISMATDRAIRLALLVTELVTNAAKHACGEDGKGEVRVQLSSKDETTARIAVSDDGEGLPADFTLEQPSGFGTRLVKILAEQMGAEVIVERPLRGTTFIVTMSLDPDSSP
jgi:two-component sensor histidine kinase